MTIESSSTPGSPDRPVTAPAETANLVALTRQDVAAMLAAYRAANNSPRQWLPFVAGIGGLFFGTMIIPLGKHFHWPRALGLVLFAVGWSVMLLCLYVVTRRQRQLRERYRIECPACGETLFDRRSEQRSVARTELAIATGSCPSCGAHFLAQ